MQTIRWEVAAAGVPRAVRHCKKCHKRTEYASSGLFRINAQQRCLDVWLIYKCTRCDCTWKLTVFSRVSRRSLDDLLLERLCRNDAALAARYACDLTLLKKHGAEVILPEVQITGPEIALTAPAKILIINSYPAPVRLAGVLRQKLGLSNAALRQMAEEQVIAGPAGCNLLRYKLKDTVEITFQPRV